MKTKITDADIAFMNQGYERIGTKWTIVRNVESYKKHFYMKHSNYGMTYCGRDIDNPKFQTIQWNASFSDTLINSRDTWNTCRTCVNQFRIQTDLKEMRAW